MKKDKHSIPDRPFMNLTIEEMAEHVRAREAALNRRNCLVLSIFFVLFAVGFAVSTWYYGHWMLETIDAMWQLGLSLWRLEWWRATEILLQYRLSFFVLGLIIGFGLFLFITFQIGEMIIEHLWHLITGLFN